MSLSEAVARMGEYLIVAAQDPVCRRAGCLDPVEADDELGVVHRVKGELPHDALPPQNALEDDLEERVKVFFDF